MAIMRKLKKGYGLNECPPIREAIPFSIQHTLIAVFTVLPGPLLISAGLGFSVAETAIMISGALLVVGISALLQTLGFGPVGGKLPLVIGGSFCFITPALLLAPAYGFGGYMGACLVGSFIAAVLWILFSNKIERFLPPYITGAVVMTLGICLVGVAINYCAGGVGSAGYGSLQNYGIALATLIVVLICNQFGKPFVKGVSPLIGIVVGFILCAAFGMIDFTPLKEAAWFGLPEVAHWGLSFPLGPVVTVTFLCIICIVELLGDASSVTMSIRGTLPEKKEIKGSLWVQGITSCLAAVFNGVPTITYSPNVGLLGITNVYSRYVVSISGGTLILCSLCPKLSTLCSIIPQPVFGGAILMTFGVILVNGIGIITNTKLTPRSTLVVAISLAVGIGFNNAPAALSAFPFWVSTLLSGVPGTALVGIILNLVLPKEKTAATPAVAEVEEAQTEAVTE